VPRCGRQPRASPAAVPASGLARYTAANGDMVLPGCPYDYPAYAGFALEVLKLRTEAQLDPVFREDHWRVCSALVADCYAFAGADLEAGLKYPNLISPADLYDMIAHGPDTSGSTQG
jgi:hypothetical protein